MITHAEHVERIHRTLKTLHKALNAHHAALAAFAVEYGAEAGVDEEIIAQAAAPKDAPPND